mgnify:FL=1
MFWQEILDRQQSWTKENSSSYRLTQEEAVELYRNAPLHELMSSANKRRTSMVDSNQVTFLVDRNINYTNVCTINCQFCSFYRPPGHEENYTQSYQEISQRVSELEEIGGSRILMQGGVNPDLEIEWYLDLLKFLRENHPNIHLDCFSPIEIEGIAEVSNLSTLEVLKRFSNSGMHGLPGGGAEMLVDTVRKDISPKKGLPENWLRIMKEAQSLGLTTSATNVIGFGESLENRVEHLAKIRDLQDESIRLYDNGFTSFIAWPVQLESNTFGKRNRGTNKYTLGAGPTEYLRHVAISRLFLDSIDHIQASWPTMGVEIAQMALLCGADDAGSTMMEENVVSASGTSKISASERELQNTIIRAGFTPQKRDSDYNKLLTEIPEDLLRDLPAPIPIQS